MALYLPLSTYYPPYISRYNGIESSRENHGFDPTWYAVTFGRVAVTKQPEAWQKEQSSTGDNKTSMDLTKETIYAASVDRTQCLQNTPDTGRREVDFSLALSQMS
jgi:hypothetical protein